MLGGHVSNFSPTTICLYNNLLAQNDRVWSTYYGGAENDRVRGVATDLLGNVYMTGTTSSPSAIAYGGSHLSTNGYGVSVDKQGNVVLAGYTRSPDGIAYNGFQNVLNTGSNAFLVKFDASGNRLWSTYYGGDNGAFAYDVATDQHGNSFLVGYTMSEVGIAHNGFQNQASGSTDGFLVKFSSSGDRIWATYYGGDEADYGFNVVTDLAGNVFISGTTASNTGMAYNGYQNEKAGMGFTDDYIVKFDANGNRIWATYYGGTGYDTHGLGSPEELGGISTDAAGNVYLAGATGSQVDIALDGFQNERVGYDNLYLVKFDSIGTRLCATYYRKGPLSEHYPCVATDPFGHVYLGGVTNSSAPGLEYNGFQNIPGGAENAYLVRLTGCGTLDAGIIPIYQPCSDFCEAVKQVSPSGGTPPYSYVWNTIPVQTTPQATELCPGIYEVTVIDALDSVVEVQANVSSGSVQPLLISEAGDTLYVSQATSYQWYLNDEPITGTTSQSYQIQISGNYRVEGVVGDCLLSSFTIEMTCACVTGIEPSNQNTRFSVFPNPTTDGVNIQFVESFVGQIIIIDAVGRQICSYSVSNKLNTLSLPKNSGGYLIQLIELDGTLSTSKVVKN